MRPTALVFTCFLASFLLVPPTALADAARDACGPGAESARTENAALHAWTDGCTGAQAWSPMLYCGGAEAGKEGVHASLLSGYGCRTGVVVEREAPGLP